MTVLFGGTAVTADKPAKKRADRGKHDPVVTQGTARLTTVGLF
ncbi:hypothetical protein [Niveispirillum sp. BGYR6]|nr:hypothetical protein [Niveispirillum sp. BGYR6]MDG5496182.1 hypothetical protein [Niveispirillum sp. BGYR6]